MSNVFLQATEDDGDHGPRFWSMVLSFHEPGVPAVLTIEEYRERFPNRILLGVHTDVKTIRSFAEYANRAFRPFWQPVYDAAPTVTETRVADMRDQFIKPVGPISEQYQAMPSIRRGGG